jgi:DNA-binding transcriptional MocR family regulator
MARSISAARVITLLGPSWERSPMYAALADGLRLLISDGRIPAGTRLPSERELTTELGVSRTTVTRAYDRLRERGYLRSRQGSGSVTSVPQPAEGRSDSVLSPAHGDADLLDLTCAAPVSPPGVVAAFETAVAELPAYLGGTGYFPSGLPALKERIAQRYTDRGVPTSPDQIVVTNGALSAQAVVARYLLAVGDRVIVETPGYPNTLAGLRRTGARLVGTTVDSTGWDIEALRTTIRQAGATAAVLVPDFHNPTGALMPDEHRAEIGQALSASNVVAVVDETLVEMALDEVRMPAPMAAHVSESISVGSASKTFWGGLRVGWIRAPRRRAGDLISTRLALDLGAPLVEQLALSHLMDVQAEVLGHRRDQLRASRRALTEALERLLPEWRHTLPKGGLALWCELPRPLSTPLAASAERLGVLLAPGPSFTSDGSHERFVRLPYTRSAEELVVAVERIAAAWEVAQRDRRTRRARVPMVA